MPNKKFVILLLLLTNYVGCAMALKITSSAFSQGHAIPKQYTCDGANISPPLDWQQIPANTQSFALIMDDPDAPVGVWDHWILFNIPKNITHLKENLQTLPPGAVAGNNSWGKATYGGPCPPSGTHRYYFKLYALDAVLSLPNGASKKDVERALQTHLLEKAELMGTYRHIAIETNRR